MKLLVAYGKSKARETLYQEHRDQHKIMQNIAKNPLQKYKDPMAYDSHDSSHFLKA
jgi:hypothetical protein